MSSEKMTTSSKKRCYIQGPAYYRSTAEIFKEFDYDIVKTKEEADFLILTGGEDVNPQRYGESPNGAMYWDDARDRVDFGIAKYGFTHNIPVIGICRGAQVLCVAHGGKLKQDIPNHEYGSHEILDVVDGKVRRVLSIHHQEMVPTEDAELVAYATLNSEKDTEVLWYPKSKSLAFQSHPEFSDKETADYFFLLMNRYYHSNP